MFITTALSPFTILSLFCNEAKKEATRPLQARASTVSCFHPAVYPFATRFLFPSCLLHDRFRVRSMWCSLSFLLLLFIYRLLCTLIPYSPGNGLDMDITMFYHDLIDSSLSETVKLE